MDECLSLLNRVTKQDSLDNHLGHTLEDDSLFASDGYQQVH